MVEGRIAAAEHDTMPKTKKLLGSDNVSAELKDGLEDSGMGVLGVLGDMNLNAVTKDETYDDASSTEGPRILVTEPEVTVKANDGTWGSDVLLSDASFLVNQSFVEESITQGGTSGDGEPGMSGSFTNESTICVSKSMWVDRWFLIFSNCLECNVFVSPYTQFFFPSKQE